MTQNIEWNYEDDLTSVKAGRRISEFEPTGIWNGFDLSVETNSSARILPGVMTIGDQQATVNHQVRMEIPDYEIVTSVTPTTPWIVAQWEYTANEDNEVNLTTMNSYPSDDETIVIAKGEFDGSGDLNGFDKSVRTIPRTQILEDYDFIVQSQEDVHEAFESPEINDIFVHADNGPFRLYHTREDRKLQIPTDTRKVVTGDASFNNSAGIHFQETQVTGPLLEIDAGLIFEDLLLQATTDVTFIQTVVDYTPAVIIKDTFVRADSPNTKLLDLQSSTANFQATLKGNIFHGFDNAPVTGYANADDFTWHSNTVQGGSGAWTDDKKLHVVKESRLDAETVDGHTVTRETSFDAAGPDELLPQELINDKLALEGQGIEGSVDTVDNLPTASNFDAGSIYIVNEDSFETTNTEVVDSGQNIAYPAGYWMAVNTSGDADEAEQWELLTRLQTDVTRDEFMELKPSPTSPPSMDVLIQGGPYSTINGSETINFSTTTVSFSAPASDARIDLVTVDDQGNIEIVEGTVGPTPDVPAYPAQVTVIAEVKVSSTTTEINQFVTTQADFDSVDQGIRDVRPLIGSGGGGSGSIQGSATTVDDLPALPDSQVAVSDFYIVNEPSTSTTNGSVQATGGGYDYPSGFWQAIDTGSNGVADTWTLVSDEAVENVPRQRPGGGLIIDGGTFTS